MHSINKKYSLFVLIGLVVSAGVFFYTNNIEIKTIPLVQTAKVESENIVASTTSSDLNFNKKEYEQKLWVLANNPSSSSTSSTFTWPAKIVYPKSGAILPFNRIIAYYGNLYSKGMGILGEYSEDEVLRRLKLEVETWNKADSSTPALPAVHYIAVVAQAGPTRDGKYRARMPDKEIDKVLKMAEKINALVFLDIQAGLSNVEVELPLLEKYLKLPNVHLGLDPEFYMKDGGRPGERIGTLDAGEVNYAIEYLSKIVNEYNMPPKVLVIHRFTRPMLTHSSSIKPTPEVQVVINMDGFGAQQNKIATYKNFVAKEPVQYTGFKIFYKNDSVGGRGLLMPEQLLKLSPIPVYIQYQ